MPREIGARDAKAVTYCHQDNRRSSRASTLTTFEHTARLGLICQYHLCSYRPCDAIEGRPRKSQRNTKLEVECARRHTQLQYLHVAPSGQLCPYLFMFDPSFNVLPVAPVFLERSEPARSTKFNFAFKLVSRVTPSPTSSVVFFSTCKCSHAKAIFPHPSSALVDGSQACPR